MIYNRYLFIELIFSSCMILIRRCYLVYNCARAMIESRFDCVCVCVCFCLAVCVCWVVDTVFCHAPVRQVMVVFNLECFIACEMLWINNIKKNIYTYIYFDYTAVVILKTLSFLTSFPVFDILNFYYIQYPEFSVRVCQTLSGFSQAKILLSHQRFS